MFKYNDRLPTFIVHCVLFIGGLYEILFSGNFSNYSTSGKVKTIIVMVAIAILILLYIFRDKSKDHDDDE
jgi:hypothetical protein